ncbi:MAG TPA: TonB-dependent receptor, partial [Bryobacteraceae bacterium]
ANQYYNNAQGIGRPDYKMNQYGADVGGPLPGKKTFWFASWQGQRFSVDIPGTPTVYTASARAGIFRYVVGTINGQTKASPALVDPHTGSLLPGVQTCGGSVTTNCIQSVNLSTLGATAPATAGGPFNVDPAMAKFFNAAPLPNLYTAGDGLNTAGYGWNRPTQDPQARFMGRIDHNFNKDNSIFFRFIISRDNTALGDPINGGYETFPGFPTTETSTRKPANYAANYRRVISPHMINSFTGGVARFQYAFPNDFTNSTFPTIPPYSVSNVTNPFANPTAGGISNQPGLSRTLTTLQALDDLSWEHGAHMVSAGFNFRFQRQNDSRSSVGSIYSAPVVNFSGSVRDPSLIMTLPAMNTTDLGTLKNYLDEWLGLPSSQSLGYFAASPNSYTPSNLYIRGQRFHQYDGYVQDQWKVKPNFTLNLGVRWEFNPPPTETHDLLFLPNQLPSIWSPSDPVSYHPATQFWSRENADALGPRVGLAWTPFPDGKTVIRSGYGIYFDTVNTYQVVPFVGAIPGSSAACTVQVTNTASKTSQVTPSSNCVAPANQTAQISNGYVVGLPAPTIPPSAFFSPAPAAKGVAPQAGEIDPNLKVATVHQWNFSVQRDLGHQTVLEASYVGSHGVHLPRAYDLNQLNINGAYLQSFNTARSNLIKCGNPAGTTTCGQSVGVLQSILGTVLNTTTATTPLLNGSAAGLANTIDTTYYSQMAAATGNPGYFRSNPQFGTILYMDSSSASSYNALQLHLRRHESSLDFGVSYTFSKSIDDASGDPIGSSSTGGVSSTTAPTDIHNFTLDRGRSDFDRTQVLTTYQVWQVPVGKGRKWASSSSKFLDALIGGWSLSNIVTWMTGEPFSISSGILTADNIRSSRAQIVAPIPSFGFTSGVPGNVGPGWIPASALNAATTPFGIPAPGTYGNQGRNIFNSPDFFNIDMTLQKQFSVTERWKVQLKFDAFNIFNHPNFRLANPITAFSGTSVSSPSGSLPQVVTPTLSSSFGTLCCASAYLPSSSSATGVGEPSRVLQVAVRVSF